MATRPFVRRRHAQNAPAFARRLGGVLQQIRQDALQQVLVRHALAAHSSARRQS